MTEKLMVAILELRSDAGNLEARSLQQLDQRRTRVEDHVRAKVLHRAFPLRKQEEKAFGVERRQQQYATGLEQVFDSGERVVRVSHVLKYVIERHGVEGRAGIDESRQRRAVHLETSRAGGARDGRRAIDA